MNEEIKAAIEKSLPGEVSATLQKVLAQAEQDADAVTSLSTLVKDLEVRVKDQSGVERQRDINKTDMALIDSRGAALDTQKALADLRDELTQGFLKQYNFMWAQVFSSPEGKKLAFTLNGFTDSYSDNNGTYHQGQGVGLTGEIKEESTP